MIHFFAFVEKVVIFAIVKEMQTLWKKGTIHTTISSVTDVNREAMSMPKKSGAF